MDIDKLISEYNNFLKNYEKGEMFKIRNTMRQLSHIIVSKLNSCKNFALARFTKDLRRQSYVTPKIFSGPHNFD